MADVMSLLRLPVNYDPQSAIIVTISIPRATSAVHYQQERFYYWVCKNILYIPHAGFQDGIVSVGLIVGFRAEYSKLRRDARRWRQQRPRLGVEECGTGRPLSSSRRLEPACPDVYVVDFRCFSGLEGLLRS